MNSVELISISALNATTFAVKLRANGRDSHDLVMEVQTSADGSVTSVRPPDSLRNLIGPDPRVARPVFDAVLAFWRAQPPATRRGPAVKPRHGPSTGAHG